MADQPGVATGEVEAERVQMMLLTVADPAYFDALGRGETPAEALRSAVVAVMAADRLDAARSAGPRSTPAEPSEAPWLPNTTPEERRMDDLLVEGSAAPEPREGLVLSREEAEALRRGLGKAPTSVRRSALDKLDAFLSDTEGGE